MGLDYIGREQNKLADALARDGSSLMFNADQNYRITFNLEKLIENVNFK